ncbi:hypothetical protein LOZ12_001479 [Ophidiomyces ophidiicola]|uniref:Uncharacterized protein n=1 Tax=Ophidiomyces ophidiicola TaxID=1387563 RepID=A0ACB8V4T2_9EURO|nr:hypothetical protein LOZ64_003463 [Ophidiomyces ophidiicola]KAI1938822.1 hypothetical protein LOZ62_005148 [Ophidiomyces ophidiicola]KAI1957845.1 hypothetical protein LOZ59_003736 [Ophidiomyces ophidiicola]KAI2002572.1 hypothetical protein LOZ50_004922 [Ophidiomyces ophidiicola]KAI2017832.1 hypothetical protein LOZ46_004220 [Ophidiomyces ophidiicola]
MSEKSWDFNPAALKAKYAAERTKRIRKEGVHQYQTAEGTLRHFTDDPYVEPGFHRPPVTEDVNVLIIGGGFAGQLAAVRLLERGVKDFRIVEKAGDFGGTWYWNRYPGVSCDIESFVYLPLLEEMEYMPSKNYIDGQEIFKYTRMIGCRYGLYEKTLFQTVVTQVFWNKSKSTWIANTTRRDIIRATFIVMASGILSKAKLPGVPGIEKFKGRSFHTSRWDYQFTGGDHNGGLKNLASKRVGLIGTGASSVQVVPHLAHSAAHLYVFQRTPVGPVEALDYPAKLTREIKLPPGWQKKRREQYNLMIEGIRKDIMFDNDIAGDIFYNLSRHRIARMLNTNDDDMISAERRLIDFMRMEKLRKRISAIVKDPVIAEKLKPWYGQMCKRSCFDKGYLPSFNRPNVTLVDTNGNGVQEITKDGVIANGEKYVLDCIIYATGFEVGTDFSRRLGAVIVGEKGETLSDHWKNGVRTYHGMYTRGFPNCFIMNMMQFAYSPNFSVMIEEQSIHIAHIVSEASKQGICTVQPTEKAEEEWVESVVQYAARIQSTECTPAYANFEGATDRVTLQQGAYSHSISTFTKMLEEWRADGRFQGLECGFKKTRPGL